MIVSVIGQMVPNGGRTFSGARSEASWTMLRAPNSSMVRLTCRPWPPAPGRDDRVGSGAARPPDAAQSLLAFAVASSATLRMAGLKASVAWPQAAPARHTCASRFSQRRGQVCHDTYPAARLGAQGIIKGVPAGNAAAQAAHSKAPTAGQRRPGTERHLLAPEKIVAFSKWHVAWKIGHAAGTDWRP